MKLKKILTGYLITCLMLACNMSSVFAQYEYPFQNPKLDMEVRIDNIVSLVTLEEKIGLITSFQVPRLNIPSPGSAEGIHQAVIRGGFQPGSVGVPTTSFAQVYGMGSTWNPDLIQQAGAVAGYEARYVTQSEKYKRSALVLWGPTSDLARDPRWGRNDESFSEDPFLTGTMVVAYIKGIQGDDPNYWQAGSLLKHVFANSNETTRGRSSSDFDDRLMREYYSVPFRMGFTEGGAKSYMAAYNAWNGIPMHVNPVLKDVVADEWGANWIVTSDAGAIRTIVAGHKYIDSLDLAFAESLKLGMNQYLEGNVADNLNKALSRGLITERDVDAVIRNKLKTTIKLGLLDPPEMVPYSKIGAAGETEPWETEKHKSVARQVARESVVMLKNVKDILPLDRTAVKSIAVIGPRAGKVLADFYSGVFPYTVSVLQGIQDKAGSGIAVNYAEDNEYQAAVDAAKASDVAVVVVGNDPYCGAESLMGQFNDDLSTKPCLECGDGREGRDRQSLDLPSEDLIKEVFAANPNTIVVLISSFPYAICWSQEHVPAILHITHAAQEQGTAIADVLFGDYNPGGRLVQTWPKSLAQLPYMLDYDIRNGRTYMYVTEQPLYAFGYGLSYTTFGYSNLAISADMLSGDGKITVRVDVKNAGDLDGDEVVQLYVQHFQSKVARPLKALKGFKRVHVKAGETVTVEIPLDAEALAYWDETTGTYKLEAGQVKLMVGNSSDNILLEKFIPVKP